MTHEIITGNIENAIERAKAETGAKLDKYAYGALMYLTACYELDAISPDEFQKYSDDIWSFLDKNYYGKEVI